MSREPRDLFSAEMRSSQDLLMFLDLFPKTENAEVTFLVYVTGLKIQIDSSHTFSMTCTLQRSGFEKYDAASVCEFRVSLSRLIHALSVLGAQGGQLTMRYVDTGEPLQLRLVRDGAVMTCQLATLAPTNTLAAGYAASASSASSTDLAGSSASGSSSGGFGNVFSEGVTEQSEVSVALLKDALQSVLCSKAKRARVKMNVTTDTRLALKERLLNEAQAAEIAFRERGNADMVRRSAARIARLQNEVTDLRERPDACALPLLEVAAEEEAGQPSITVSFPTNTRVTRPRRRGKGLVPVFAHHCCSAPRDFLYTLNDLKPCVKALGKGFPDSHCLLRVNESGALGVEVDVATRDEAATHTVAFTLMPHDDSQHQTRRP